MRNKTLISFSASFIFHGLTFAGIFLYDYFNSGQKTLTQYSYMQASLDYSSAELDFPQPTEILQGESVPESFPIRVILEEVLKEIENKSYLFELSIYKQNSASLAL